jgi:hypothetical protein
MLLPVFAVLLAADERPLGDKHAQAPSLTPVIWGHPGRIESRDLRYGPGSARLMPRAPFTFVEEMTSGRTPKFLVRDGRNIEWIVKLGPEAQSEIASSRILWAVGYFADEAYYLRWVRIHGLPALARGDEHVRAGGHVLGARFERRLPASMLGDSWEWDDNPFVGTRELGGLKVMMVLLNNWDARDPNNQVRLVRKGRTREARFMVSDLGATLGRTGGWGKHSKNDVADFVSSRFVDKVQDGKVEFHYDTQPSGWALASIVYPPYYLREFGREKHFERVPLEHARWIGTLLSRLTSRQLRDALAAAGYERRVADAYVGKLRERIRELTALPAPDPVQRVAESISRRNGGR